VKRSQLKHIDLVNSILQWGGEKYTIRSFAFSNSSKQILDKLGQHGYLITTENYSKPSLSNFTTVSPPNQQSLVLQQKFTSQVTDSFLTWVRCEKQLNTGQQSTPTWLLISISKKLSSGTSCTFLCRRYWLMTAWEFKPGNWGRLARWSFIRDPWIPATMSRKFSLSGVEAVKNDLTLHYQ